MFLIGVDFDGTIVDHAFPEIGADNPRAIEWLLRWRHAGARLILFTMRSDGRTKDGSRANDDVLSEAVAYLKDRGVELFGVNENPVQKSWTKSPKPYCHVYVDDAGFGCPLRPSPSGRPMVDWEKVGPAVLEMILAHRKEVSQ